MGSFSTLQNIVWPVANQKNIVVSILRLDQIGGMMQGNKFFKLKYNIEHARKENIYCLLSFGGAWSNHLHALGFAAKENKFRSIGLVRGEKPEKLSETLLDCQQNGMELYFVSREKYRNRNSVEFLADLKVEFPDCLILPEGGSNTLAVRGCYEIGSLIPKGTDVVLLPCGTGATSAGIIAALPETVQVVPVAVLKGGDFLKDAISAFILDFFSFYPQLKKKYASFNVELNYHCGGYAKINKELLRIKNQFEVLNAIELDFVYTAKMLLAFDQMVLSGQIPSGSRVVLIHTGGIQGNRGFRNLPEV